MSKNITISKVTFLDKDIIGHSIWMKVYKCLMDDMEYMTPKYEYIQTALPRYDVYTLLSFVC